MRLISLAILAVILTAGCSNKCLETQCGTNQACNNGMCSCIPWYEGTNCQTPMRQKWIGTFIGTTHTNANLAGRTDTFTFIADTSEIDYCDCTNKNFLLSLRNTREASIPFWVNSTGITASDSALTNSTGVGIVSEDGKYATLTWTTVPVLTYIPNIDSTLIFTFEGTKQ